METSQGSSGARIEISRRDMIGGSLFLGLAALSGCAGGGGAAMTRLPDPKWNAPGDSTVVSVPPQTQPLPPRQPGAAGPNISVLPRSAWTSNGVARPQNINPMNGVSRITVHHDGMNAFTSTSQADAARRIEQIRGSHIQRKAKSGERWADIGYHYIVDPAGRVWEGRSTQYQGAHVEDQNEHNLGIMMLGNYDRQQPTSASMDALERMLTMQMRRYRISLARVRTHRELAPTECPGDSLQAFMNQTRSRSGRLALAVTSMPLV